MAMDDFDSDKIDDAVLAFLSLTLTSEKGVDGGRAWKSFDWAAMDRLFLADISMMFVYFVQSSTLRERI